ncbi:TrgA family protein [Thalassococcus sp. BH17M4-6]|uniref:TrgA family protein n=1 Tax=Thalassococcus sp. BH17M4-6 TaxID=3413148 RepID=UPI003BDAF1FA
MPTAARLFAAICLAILGFVVSGMIKQVMPPSTNFGIFSYVNAFIGLVCGWVIVGSRAGRGTAAAISNGFTGMVAMVLIGLGVQAINEMTRLAMKHRFDGPVEAFAAIFELGIEYGSIMLTAPIVLTLFVGAIVTGLVTEFAARNYR